MACSLYGSCVKAGIEPKYDSILEKYKLNDWFSKKVDAYRASFGESINEALARETLRILNRAKKGDVLEREEIDVLKHMSDKHRTAQPFFVTRTETAQVDDSKIGKILDTIESTNYDEVAREARKQMVAANKPLQDQKQTGADNNIPPEQPTDQTPSGTVKPQVQSYP